MSTKRQERPLLLQSEIDRYLKRFPVLQRVGNAVKCCVCDKYLSSCSIWCWKKHLASARHKRNIHVEFPYTVFWDDLIFTSSVCNIPLAVVDQPNFQAFWKKYVPKWKLPTRAQLKYNQQRIRKHIEQDIQKDLKNRKIRITVGEITDRQNNKVCNVLVHILSSSKALKPYLLASKRLAQTNAEAIQHLVQEAIDKFCIERNNVLMLVTDGTAYMIKAGKLLKNIYPNALHITCVIHALHRVAETIRKSYPDVDTLISATKKIFLKAPHRIEEFRNSCPGIALPPQPIITRWGAWLEAVFYYNTNFHAVASVVSKFDLNDSKAISVSQQLFAKPQVEADLHTIQANYRIVAAAIDQLQEASLSLNESFEIVDDVQKALQIITEEPAIRATMKMNDVLIKNPDLLQLRNINQSIRDGHHISAVQQWLVNANITSADLERSFSRYKAIYSEKRTRLKESTIEGILMMQMFSQTQPVNSMQ